MVLRFVHTTGAEATEPDRSVVKVPYLRPRIVDAPNNVTIDYWPDYMEDLYKPAMELAGKVTADFLSQPQVFNKAGGDKVELMGWGINTKPMGNLETLRENTNPGYDLQSFDQHIKAFVAHFPGRDDTGFFVFTWTKAQSGDFTIGIIVHSRAPGLDRSHSIRLYVDVEHREDQPNYGPSAGGSFELYSPDNVSTVRIDPDLSSKMACRTAAGTFEGTGPITIVSDSGGRVTSITYGDGASGKFTNPRGGVSFTGSPW